MPHPLPPPTPNTQPEEELPLEETSASYEFPWETLDALVEGKSPIDLSLMPVKTPEEAFDLVYRYGYDTRNPEELKETLDLIAEAVAFMEKRFLDNPLEWQAFEEPVLPLTEVPDFIKQIESPEQLVLMAANGPKPERLWACATLKVLHTLAHLHNNPLLRFYQQASDTIISHFHSLLVPSLDGTFNLVDKSGRAVNLYGFEIKHKKPRESILIKLLCKKETVAEDVRDLVGVRIITHEAADALLAIDILRAEKVLLFSNIIPSRSKNNLFDFEQLRTSYEKALSDMERGKIPQQDVLALLRSLPLKPPVQHDFVKDNPSTFHEYKAIHITCRHFLRFKSSAPLMFYQLEDELLPFLSDEHSTEVQRKGDIRLAFPYEIQILDEKSYKENQSGKSAHALYKQKQLATARRRVLGSLFKFYAD